MPFVNDDGISAPRCSRPCVRWVEKEVVVAGECDVLEEVAGGRGSE